MKIKYIVVLGCFGIFFSSYAYSGTCCVQTQTYTSSSYSGCANGISECDCSNPQCVTDNPCLSRARCCKLFGNMGGS